MKKTTNRLWYSIASSCRYNNNNQIMKVLAPVKNLLSWIEIVKAWAEEIYFGVVSDDWEGKYDFKNILNRRDGRLANISSYEDGKKLIDFARSHGTESYITLNNSPVIDDIELVRKEIENCIRIGPDALIVKDIFIASLIREMDANIQIHCSSLNQVINRQAIEFWRENFGISRMIFPRNVSVNEIRNLCQTFPDLEFEIFIKNDWCYNSDGVCSSLHLEGLKDGIPYVCNRELMYKSDDEVFDAQYKTLVKNTLDCKVCMLSQLADLDNLISLKIVGREKALDIILKDIAFVKSSLKFLSLADSTQEFMDFNIRNHQKLIHKECWYKNCEVYNMYY